MSAVSAAVTHESDPLTCAVSLLCECRSGGRSPGLPRQQRLMNKAARSAHAGNSDKVNGENGWVRKEDFSCSQGLWVG